MGVPVQDPSPAPSLCRAQALDIFKLVYHICRQAGGRHSTEMPCCRCGCVCVGGEVDGGLGGGYFGMA